MLGALVVVLQSNLKRPSNQCGALRGPIPTRRSSRHLVNRATYPYPYLCRIVYNLAMGEPALNARIQSLRDQLDEIDVEIVRTLNERARLLHDLATIKGEAGAQLFDPQREEEILQRVAEENPGPIYDSTMREIFAVIMHRIRDIEAQH
jgi:chorismate mutase